MTYFRLIPIAAACMMLSHVAGAQERKSLPPPPPSEVAKQIEAKPAVAANNSLHLQFMDTEIEQVARAIGVMLGKVVIVDPKVKGTITLWTETPVRPAAALRLFTQVLRLRNYALIQDGSTLQVVAEADAKLMNAPVASSQQTSKELPAGIVTKVFTLTHETANNVLPLLRPLISPNNTINANGDSLVVTDYAENLQKIQKIIQSVDVPKQQQVEIVALNHTLANDVASIINKLGDSMTTAGQPGTVSLNSVVVADPKTNALIVKGKAVQIEQVKALVARLDRPQATKSTGNIHVVRLKNADAQHIAATLRGALGVATSVNTSGNISALGKPAGSGGATTPGTTTPPTNSAPAANTAVVESSFFAGSMVQADVATNSLVITAPEPAMRQIKAVIDELDTRRAQVYVESLIAEVNADTAAEFGIQWQTPLGKKGDGTIGLMGTNFGTNGNNLVNLATGAQNGVLPGAGLNLGAALRTNGVYYLGALARFLQQNGQGNILSTPNLLTLDNEEANIVIGQNVPFITGQYTNNNSNSGSVNPFQTIERKDVGLTLRVKPQVSENGTVKMTIFQEVSNVVASSVNSAAGLITNKRAISSSVLVQDGSIVVLGGLLQDEMSNSQDKVPGLGDAPIVGSLFRTENRARKKTNLMVFLRPVIIREGDATTALSQQKYDEMRTVQQGTKPAKSIVLPNMEPPVVPAR